MTLVPTPAQSLSFRFRLSLALLSTSLVLAQTTVSPRWGHAATVVGNTLYIHGGKIDQNNAYSYTSAPNTDELLALNFEKAFDLGSIPWTTLNATGGPLVAFHTITAYSTSQALVFGGDAGTSVPLPTRNDSAWQLTINGASASWTSRSEGWAGEPMRRQYHSSVVYKDIVYIVGGEKADGSNIAFSQPYTFNPSGPTFTGIAAANGPPGLVGHATLALGDGRIIILGGLSRSTNTLLPLDTIYVYNIAQSSWSTLAVGNGSTPVPRRNFAATVINTDKILIHGGADASFQTALSDGAILDLMKLQWSAVPALSGTLGSRFDHTAATVGTSVFFLFGFDGTKAVQNIVQLLDLTTNTFLNTFTPTSSTKPNTNDPPNPSQAPSNSNGNNGNGNDGSSSTNGGSNGNNSNNSGTDNPSDPSHSHPADKNSSSPLRIVLASVLGVLGFFAAAAVIFIIVAKKGRKTHQRNWSSLSEEPEKLIMVGGFGATQREGIVNRLMNVGKPSKMVPVKARFDILAEEEAYEVTRWGMRRTGTAGSSGFGRYGQSREPSAFNSLVNASVTSFRSAFGLSGAPPRLPQSDQTVAMNPFSDTYTAVEASRHSRRQSSLSSYRDPFGDDNVMLEDEYERAMALQNTGMRPHSIRQPSSGSGNSMPGLGGMAYVPLQPIQSVTTESHGSSQGHSNVPDKEPGVVGVAVTSAGTTSPSHEGKPNLLTKSPPHSPRRGLITFGTSPPSSPTFGPTNVNRSLSAGGRIGAGLARTVTVISSIFSADHRGERGVGQGAYDGVDFRDPNPPPPRLGAIEEAPTPKFEKGKGRLANLRGDTQQGVYGPGAVVHGRSLSSLKTANSEALERLGGKWEVVQRIATNDTAASGSMLDEDPAHTVRSQSLDIPIMESPERDREQTRPPWKPLALRSPSSSSSPPPTMSSRPIQPPKRSVSTGVAAQIEAFEKRASVDLSSKSPILIPPSSPVTQPKRRTYGLVPKPTLFVANPERETSTDS